jgi:hypothetical protein
MQEASGAVGCFRRGTLTPACFSCSCAFQETTLPQPAAKTTEGQGRDEFPSNPIAWWVLVDAAVSTNLCNMEADSQQSVPGVDTNTGRDTFKNILHNTTSCPTGSSAGPSRRWRTPWSGV